MVVDKVLLQGKLAENEQITGIIQEAKVLVGGGTYDYEQLQNKPKINGLELVGNTTIDYVTQADIDATVGNIAVLLSLV